MTFQELCKQAHELCVALKGRHVSVELKVGAHEHWLTKQVEDKVEVHVYIAQGVGHCSGGLCESVETIPQASAFLTAAFPTDESSIESIEIGEQLEMQVA